MRTQGYDPQIRTRSRFLYNAPTAKFHHPIFTRSEVIVLTNKQTDRRRWKHPTLFATLRRWVNRRWKHPDNIHVGAELPLRYLSEHADNHQFENEIYRRILLRLRCRRRRTVVTKDVLYSITILSFSCFLLYFFFFLFHFSTKICARFPPRKQARSTWHFNTMSITFFSNLTYFTGDFRSSDISRNGDWHAIAANYL